MGSLNSDVDPNITFSLSKKHFAPFLRNKKSSNLAIFYQPPEGTACTDENFAKLMDQYYNTQVLFDLIRQLVAKTGPMEYNYHWLDKNKGTAFYETWGKDLFAKNMFRSVDEIRVY
jgi:hypothetical protein